MMGKDESSGGGFPSLPFSSPLPVTPFLISRGCSVKPLIPELPSCRGSPAAYEGLYAGMPLFLSTTAGVPAPLLQQKFVDPVPFNATIIDFNSGLASFMNTVRENAGSMARRRAIIRYTRTVLHPENVYWELCERVGLCASRQRVSWGTAEDQV